jgi:ATP-dependent Lon protease
MSSFEDLSFCPQTFCGKVRLFPLPNLVLFPHVMQPLHIFEPRYRCLLEDALATDRLIAMALLAPGWENDYEGRPPLCPMACLGRVTTHHRLEDGTFNLLLLGLHRVRLLREIDPGKPYREAEVAICEDSYPVGPKPAVRILQKRLRDAFLRILPLLPEAQEQMDQLLATDIPLGVLTDVISFMLEIDICHKELLLSEVDVHHRVELLLEHLDGVAKGKTEACGLGGVFPPRFSLN